MEQSLIMSMGDEKPFIIHQLDLKSLSCYHRTCKTEYKNFNIDHYLFANPSFLYNLDKYDYINALVHYGRSNWVLTQEKLTAGQKSIKERIFKNLLNDQIKFENTEIRHAILHATPTGFSFNNCDKTWFNKDFFLSHISIKNPAFGICDNGFFSFKQEFLDLWVILKICRQFNDIDYDGNTLLHAACREGNLKAVKILTKKLKIQDNTININQGNFNYRHTPLHLACLSHSIHTGLISKLLKHGARINALDWENNLPIHLACLNKNYLFVKFLLKHGAIVNFKNNQGDLPLHIACRNKDYPMAHLLFHHDPTLINITNNNENTPLEIAERNNDLDLVLLLQGKEQVKTLRLNPFSLVNNDFIKGSLFGLIAIGFLSYCYKKIAYDVS